MELRYLDLVNNFKNKRITIIGDSILDEYIYGKMIGQSLETPTPKFRIERKEYSYGGAGNVVKNMLELGAKANFITVFGNDEYYSHFRSFRHENLNLRGIVQEKRKNIVKTRYWDEKNKVFQADNLPESFLEGDSESQIIENAFEYIKNSDVLVVVDYRHGMMSNFLIDKLNMIAKENMVKTFASSQVSQSKSNHIDYSGYDFIVMNENEAKIVNNAGNFSQENLSELPTKLN